VQMDQTNDDVNKRQNSAWNAIWRSAGRINADGYVVEMAIPFSQLRFPRSSGRKTWGIDVVRFLPRENRVRLSNNAIERGRNCYLCQLSTVSGFENAEPGRDLEVVPAFIVSRTDERDDPGVDPLLDGDVLDEASLNVRWGLTPDITANLALNPDFSQVEADVGVVTVNERFAVFYPEKRPFFLEGLEQFDTPNQLVYMRRIVQPVGGAKLTGKIGSTNVGFLSAVDARGSSTSGEDNPIYNLLRIRHDLGKNSTVGLSYTDKIDGGSYNRVASADVHLVFAKMYFVEAQLAGGFTRTDDASRFGPLWEVTADRTGRSWGFNYSVKGIHPDFETQSGFVPRTGIVEPHITNRISTYGSPGAFLESFTAFIMMGGTWDYDQFFHLEAPLETSVRANNRFTLRGGWTPSVTPTWQTAAFDPEFYGSYYTASTSNGAADTVPFMVPDRVNDAVALSFGLSTPQFPLFAANLGLELGKDIAYFEPSRANTLGLNATVNLRPTEQLRVELRYAYARLDRERDGSRLSTAHIPRVKLEYQVSRPLFVRLVGQYTAQERDALRDPRTDESILFYDPDTDSYEAAAATTTNDLRLDLLLSFRPTPGTVLFLGYGSSLTETDRFRFRDLERVADGFFAKVSYLLRM